MIVLGLTGSIGMGKSTVGFEARFPGTTGAGGVDRTALAERVLGEREALRNLEALIHPAVAREREAFVQAHRDEPLVVLDIPLLFEKGGAAQVDRIAVVSAPPEVQRRRVLSRPGMTQDKFLKILALQIPDEEKRKRADFVIPTGGSLDETRDEVRRIIACLKADGDS